MVSAPLCIFSPRNWVCLYVCSRLTAEVRGHCADPGAACTEQQPCSALLIGALLKATWGTVFDWLGGCDFGAGEAS
jgi:hypothetical protein